MREREHRHRRDREPRLVLFRSRWHLVWYENGKRERRSLKTRDRAEAEAVLAAFNRTPAPAGTIGDIMALYLADAETRLARPQRARSSWRRLEPHCAAKTPGAITPAWCLAYGAERARAGAKTGTVLVELGVLRAALRWHDPNTPALFKLPPAPPPRERHLSRDEFERLRAAATETPHLALFLELALRTGARTAAILGLTWDRVDFERGTIDFRVLDVGGRRRKGRAVVPMNETLRRALETARPNALSPFVVEYAGRRVHSVRKGFAAAAKRAGLAGVTPHDLRRSAATWMAREGVSMSEIAAYLGHKDSRLTERVYARFSPDHLKRASRALE